jgi:hypothetical protein
MAKQQAKKLKGVKFTTPTFRVSFPHLWEPQQFMKNGKPEGKPKYGITMLFPNDMDRSEMNKNIAKAARELFGKDKEQWPESYRSPWRKGDRKKDLAGYPGHMYCQAHTLKAPGVVDQKRHAIKEEDDALYPGCYARAVVVAKAFENGANAGVTLYLQHVQKVADGEAFDGRTNAEDEFEDIESDDEEFETDEDDSEDDDEDMGF